MPSHTMHKTITEFFSVVRSECRDSTSAPFPVHAMHRYELSFGHFQCGSIMGPTVVLDVIWERFQISSGLNADLATCTVNASWLKWIEKVKWRQMNKTRNCTSWLWVTRTYCTKIVRFLCTVTCPFIWVSGKIRIPNEREMPGRTFEPRRNNRLKKKQSI
jgi:hypothetical protein